VLRDLKFDSEMGHVESLYEFVRKSQVNRHTVCCRISLSDPRHPEVKECLVEVRTIMHRHSHVPWFLEIQYRIDILIRTRYSV
jgi:hypothetical protein